MNYVEELRHAIVKQACQDLTNAIRYLQKPHKNKREVMLREELRDDCIKFFKSSWFKKICELDGEAIMAAVIDRAGNTSERLVKRKICQKNNVNNKEGE